MYISVLWWHYAASSYNNNEKSFLLYGYIHSAPEQRFDVARPANDVHFFLSCNENDCGDIRDILNMHFSRIEMGQANFCFLEIIKFRIRCRKLFDRIYVIQITTYQQRDLRQLVLLALRRLVFWTKFALICLLLASPLSMPLENGEKEKKILKID